MGLFSTADELKQEARRYLDVKDFDKAIKTFEKAFRKGDHDALFDIFECYKKSSRITIGYELLKQYVDDPEFTVEERVRICRIFVNKKYCADEYRKKAATLGSVKSQIELFYQSKELNDVDELFQYGDQILQNPDANAAVVVEVLTEYLSRVNSVKHIGDGKFVFDNGFVSQYSYVSILNKLIALETSSSEAAYASAEARVNLARYHLVDYFCQDNPLSIQRNSITETYKKKICSDIDLIQLLYPLIDSAPAARYYLSVIYAYGLDTGIPRYDLADETLRPIQYLRNLTNQHTPCASTTNGLINGGCISKLRDYIQYARLEIAAHQGDLDAMQQMQLKAIREKGDLLQYGDMILGHPEAEPALKAQICVDYLERIQPVVPVGNHRFAFSNAEFGSHNYLALLRTVIAAPSLPFRKEAIIAYARFVLIDNYFYDELTESGVTRYVETYRVNCSQHREIVPLLEEIHTKTDIARYYLALIYAFGFGLVEINYSLAYAYIEPLGDKNYTPPETAVCATPLHLLHEGCSLEMLRTYIAYRKDCTFSYSIIGNLPYQAEVNNCLSILEQQYNQWDYTSCFSIFLGKHRTVDSNIWIFDGEASNAKRTLAQDFCRRLSTYCFMRPTFQDIDPFKINTYARPEDKYGYIKSLIDNIQQWQCGVLYFDNPYLVNETSSGFDGLNNILQYIIHLMENQQNRIVVLVMAGDGDLIKRHLTALGVQEYKYHCVPFHGYSVTEAVALLNMLNKRAAQNSASIVLSEQLLDPICHLISLRNNASNRNINFDVINFIYESLRKHYFMTADKSNIDYTHVLSIIEKELGVKQQDESDFNKTMEELDSMIGLSEIKSKMRNIIALVRINKMRIHYGLKPIDNSLHMVFAGNPGTGKTTVAKMMGKILKELEVLSRGHVVEVSRSDLVDVYFGGTANKTRNVLNRALNGVLFIDEAYTLTNNARSGGMKDYGIESVEEILKFMSDHNEEICVIVAGYTQEMKDFLASNPGLQSRFNTWIDFNDYSEDELYAIFEGLCAKNDFIIQAEIKPMILNDFKKAKAVGGINFGNARFVGTYFKELVEKQSTYLTMKYNVQQGGMPVNVNEFLYH